MLHNLALEKVVKVNLTQALTMCLDNQNTNNKMTMKNLKNQQKNQNQKRNQAKKPQKS